MGKIISALLSFEIYVYSCSNRNLRLRFAPEMLKLSRPAAQEIIISLADKINEKKINNKDGRLVSLLGPQTTYENFRFRLVPRQ